MGYYIELHVPPSSNYLRESLRPYRSRFGFGVYDIDMIKRFSYWVYVVGVFVAWAIVLLIARNTISSSRFHNLLIFGCGFLLGILAASLARKVYK